MLLNLCPRGTTTYDGSGSHFCFKTWVICDLWNLVSTRRLFCLASIHDMIYRPKFARNTQKHNVAIASYTRFRKPSLSFIGRKSQFYIPYKLLNFQSVIKYYAWVTHDVGKTDRTLSIRVCALIIFDDKESAMLKHLQTFELSIFIGIWVL